MRQQKIPQNILVMEECFNLNMTRDQRFPRVQECLKHFWTLSTNAEVEHSIS